MKAKRHIQRDAKKLFRLCRVNGSLDDGRIRKVVQQVIQAKQRGFLELLSEFERLVRLNRAEHIAEVETAAALPADLQATVRARLEKSYGSGIEIRFTQKPELIGGMRVKVGSDVFDGSVQAQLAVLESRL